MAKLSLSRLVSIFVMTIFSVASGHVALAQTPGGSAADLSTCRAGDLGGYIGLPYKRLQKIRPDARFVCDGCPMTMDFRADRLTVTYDRRTRRIKSLRCV
ncbi:hypothetical protein [Terrarubrum flagellatum]|uniref:hypothetical protein n=1 Tax=Terrirubrum flagellatum TaxID=2895980 RepID=UPI00314536E1